MIKQALSFLPPAVSVGLLVIGCWVGSASATIIETRPDPGWTESDFPSAGHAYAARATLEKAARIGPDQPQFEDTLGWVLFRAGHPEKARDHLSAALRQSPHDASILYHTGAVADALGDLSGARDYLQKSLSASELSASNHTSVARAARALYKSLSSSGRPVKTADDPGFQC